MPEPQRQNLLDVPPERRAREERRALEIETLGRAAERRDRRMFAQCIALCLLGVPFYAWSWHTVDPDRAQIWAALGFAVSYAAPFFRWLVYHVRTSETFGY